MKRSFRIFYWGMLISFLGSLPPGVMNILGTQISNSNGPVDALLYVTGFMLAEAALVRISLSAMSWLSRNRRIFHLFEWMTAGMLIIFSVACFNAAVSMQQNIIELPGFWMPPFVLGVVISLINPMHIPFWLGWSNVLMNKGILGSGPGQYNYYIAGIALGTLAGFTVYVFGGQYFVNLFESNQYLINCIIGFILIITFFFHIRKMILVPVATRHARLFKKS